MRYAKPFNELGFTAKCAIVESQQDPMEDSEYRSFKQHVKNQSSKKIRDRKRCLKAILSMRNNEDAHAKGVDAL